MIKQLKNEVKLEMTRSDKVQIDNLIVLLAKAVVELKGAEIIVASDAMKFLSGFQAKLNKKFSEEDKE